MRVISGFLKSRNISVVKSRRDIRPTTDRARETLFNVLSNVFDFNGLSVLDLFAGSGSFGIECLSRGSENCCFVDSLTDSVKKNIDGLLLNDKSRIIKSDVLLFLKNNKDLKFDLIFADPPYNYGYYDKLIELVSYFKTFFILEHSGKNTNIMNCKENIIKQKDIGISSFTFYNFGNEK